MEINLAIIDFNPGQGGGVKPSGVLDISENGVYDVYSYSSASVDVHPSISLSETYISNGSYNITGEFNGGVITVDVPAPQFVTETLNVSANGTYNPGEGIDGYSQVVVDVPIDGWDQKSFTEEAITFINIDNSASFVASNAFRDNINIQTVNLPYATSVGYYAFYNCPSLTQVNLPVCSFIENQAFYNTNLTSLTLGSNSVVSLSGDDQFFPTDMLSIYVPVSLYNQYIIDPKWISYSSYIFEPLMWYDNGTLGGSITEMSRTDWESLGISGADIQRANFNNAGSFSTGTFKDCTNLSQVNLNNWQNTESEVFMGCTSLESITHTNLQQGGLILGDTTGLFSGCTNLSSLGSYVFQSLGNYMFAGTALTSYKFYLYTDYIGNYVFQSCTSLTEIDLKDMEIIVAAGTRIFDGCTNLSVIYINNEEYRTAQGWSEYSSLMSMNTEPESALSFENGLLYGSATYIDSASWQALGITTTDIISVSLPDCLSVADQTFRDCSSLQTISLPMCEYIGSSAFDLCSAISGTLYFPNCTYLGQRAFGHRSLVAPGRVDRVILPAVSSMSDYTLYLNGCSYIYFGASTITFNRNVYYNYTNSNCSVYIAAQNISWSYSGTAQKSFTTMSNVVDVYVRPELVQTLQNNAYWSKCRSISSFDPDNFDPWNPTGV